ncbi:hypothetical protein K491DRAFT_111619 [Lophiostoma macrostomum CBS 122681]|uniref:Rhodopsin domain-containing protein n=1 Tax=Lophiostoma macrostomum CBS 122681 TaxID=1314788 RepID=A0A6A6SXQ3_9PLEO|nr:hypothetical protein K491DRAFT_111619 [Lophiostoma macrostomum CBS 122681]
MGLTSLQVGLLAVFSISICLATCGIVVRFWARILLRKRWEANDYVMLVSYLAVLALVIAAFIGVLNAHVGVHVVDIPATEREEALGLNYKLVFIDTVLFATASTFANISISHFYTTIFPHLWLVRTCHVQMVLVALFWVSSVVASCLICQPLAFLWDRHLPGGGKCFDIRHFWLGGSIVSLCFDTVNVVMPMPILWRLRMDWRKKVRLTVLFGLGAVYVFRPLLSCSSSHHYHLYHPPPHRYKPHDPSTTSNAS